MIGWLIVGIIGIIILGFLLSLIYVYVQSNHALDDMILPYNDYVVLSDGCVRHVYRVMDFKAMQQQSSLEPIYPDALIITDYHSYVGVPENIENHCEDKPLSRSQILRVMAQIQKTKRK